MNTNDTNLKRTLQVLEHVKQHIEYNLASYPTTCLLEGDVKYVLKVIDTTLNEIYTGKWDNRSTK